MKINLAENMLRFGVKNLNETATSTVKTLAEQMQTGPVAPGKPAAMQPTAAVKQLKPKVKIEIDEQGLNWVGEKQKSQMSADLVLGADKKSYIISAINFANPAGTNEWIMPLTTALTYTPPLNDAFKLIDIFSSILVKTLSLLNGKVESITKLNMYINLAGGSTNTYSVSPSKSMSNPKAVADQLATAIVNGISNAKI